MTLPMLLWTIVAILALVGLIRLAVKQPVKPKRGDLLNQVAVDIAAGQFNAKPSTEDYIANPAEMRTRDQLPPKVLGPERNPAEVMRKDLVDCGLPVDHESFDRAAEWLASPAPDMAAYCEQPGGTARVGIMVKAKDFLPARKPEYRYRSAKTGRFVKAAYAKRYPHRTVRSKVKP